MTTSTTQIKNREKTTSRKVNIIFLAVVIEETVIIKLTFIGVTNSIMTYLINARIMGGTVGVESAELNQSEASQA